MTNEKNIIIWSDKILQFLLEKRKENPELRFWLRRENNKGRLEKGIWFQGDENYIFVGFSKRGAGNLSTRSIGFVVKFNKDSKPQTWLEILFKKEDDQLVIDGYKSIINALSDIEEKSEIHYIKRYNSDNILEDLGDFLDKDKPVIDKVITEKGLEKLLLIGKKEFDEPIKKTLLIRQKLKNSNKFGYLKPLIEAFEKWYITDQHSQNEDYYSDRLSFEKLEALTKTEFINFFVTFANEGGRIQSGGYRTASFLQHTFENSYDDLRRFLLEPYNDNFDVGSWLDQIGNYKGLGSGMATIYLNRINKYNYAIVNNKSINAFSLLGYEIRGKLSNQYNQIVTASKKLIEAFPRLNNLFKTDALAHFMIAEEEGKRALDSIINKKAGLIMNEIPLNQIFFGPPGTGKTFSTVDEAVKIVDPEFYQLNKGNRDLLRAKYEELIINDWDSPKGNIGFCTFHQSFSYEDFVEGIKPLPPEENNTHLKYDIVPGIFKSLVRLAESGLISDEIKDKSFISLSEEEFNKALFYKISLGNTNIPEEQKIYDYCIENNYISVGFGVGINFTGKNETGVNKLVKENNLDRFTAQVINYFKNYLKIGDYVIVSKGNYIVRAIGKVKGEYTFVENSPIEYNHFREVEWLFVNEEIPVQDVYEKLFSQQTIYKLNHSWIKKEFFTKGKKVRDARKHRNYVLIIDEINRGNISQIFGELITLIEKDKRKGGDERTQVVLPYSHESFSVPSNLFIIGTMNTADRSIEALDTALRRRFSFKEIAPDSSIIIQKGKSAAMGGIVENVNLAKLLDTINDRIEKLLDKDHRIGHSYFMKVHSLKELVDSFMDKIIPLLQEYFYGDFGKIGLVLGNAFVKIKNENDNDFSFAKFKGYDEDIMSDLKQRKIYEITTPENWTVQAFQSVYSDKNQE